jgi:hypothetical protein
LRPLPLVQRRQNRDSRPRFARGYLSGLPTSFRTGAGIN